MLVVSMTSFPAAIPYAVKAINSILEGSVLPDKMVLYLNFFQFEEGIPQELKAISDNNPIFEIRNCDDNIRSYCKLIPALRDFPEAVIVTVDDDIDYHRHMLRDLLALHLQIPNAILAHRVRIITPGVPYKKWHKYKWYNFLFNRVKINPRNLQTGVGGVLYPPHSLKKEMLDPRIFTKLAPTADDIWFWATAVASGVYVIPVPFGRNKPKELGKPHEIALSNSNYRLGVDRNTASLMAIIGRYPEIGRKIGIVPKARPSISLNLQE